MTWSFREQEISTVGCEMGDLGGSDSGDSTSRTHASLLIRVRDAADAAAWSEFHGLYAPLLYDYARSRGLNHEDAEDVRSECYQALVRQLREFEYDRTKGSFKSWLRTMVSRRVIDRLRKRRERRADTDMLREIPVAPQSDDEAWEIEWKRQHLRYCVDLVRPMVSVQIWQAFKMLAEDGDSVDAVCKSLSMNASQVYKAKARMLKLIRERMQFLQSDLE